MFYKGKTVVITGGGSGFGELLAGAYAAEDADVVITGRNVEALDRVAGTSENIRWIRMDVTDEKSVDHGIGGLDNLHCLIANAGVLEAAPIAKSTVEDWDYLVNTNARGTWLSFRAAVRKMKKHSGCSLMSISSMAAFGPHDGLGLYCVSKAADSAVTKAFAHEYAPHGITANAICPGPMQGTMVERGAARRAAADPTINVDGARAQMAAMNATGELVDPGNVVGMALFLSGPNARHFTGMEIPVGNLHP